MKKMNSKYVTIADLYNSWHPCEQQDKTVASSHSLKPLPGPTVPVHERNACPTSSLYIGL